MKKKYMIYIGMSIYMAFIEFLFNFDFGFGWIWHVAECLGSVLAKVSVRLYKQYSKF